MAQNEDRCTNKVIYVKLKSKNYETLQPWSKTFLADRDFPAKMVAPKSYQHLIPEKDNTLNYISLFRAEAPDILQIDLKNSQQACVLIHKIEEHPLVEYVEIAPDYADDLVEYTPNDPLIGSQFAIDIHNMKAAWEVEKGSSDIVIGISDSGFEIWHEDLFNNIKTNDAELNGFPNVDDDNNGFIDDVYGYNFRSRDTTLTGSSHGTPVAGAAAAVTDNNVGIAGMGFNSKFIPIVRSLGLPGIIYLAERGVDIINMSWGSPNSKSVAYQEIIDHYTEQNNVLFIAAAGNNSHNDVNTNYYPASYDNVLSVSGVNKSKVTTGRTRSYLIDVAGADGSYSTIEKNKYTGANGTSFASPTVAGIASLVKSKYPELSAPQVAELIRYTSDTTFYSIVGNENYRDRYGFGVVDAYKAVTEKDNVHVVRVQNPRWSKYGTSDISVSPGDTLAVWFDFKNILNGNSPNLIASISSYDTDLTPIPNETSHALGQMSEGQIKNNTNTPFLFKISAQANSIRNIHFKVTLEDINTGSYEYRDWQNTELNITLEQYVRFNYVKGHFRPNGTWGVNHGFDYYNRHGYYALTRQSGFIIATDNELSDATYIDINANTRKTDFVGTSPLLKDSDNSKDANYPVTTFEGTLIDENSVNPVGVNITQKLYGASRSTVDRAVFTELEITNTSNQTINNLHSGLFVDWVMNYASGDTLQNQIDSAMITYDAANQVAIIEKTDKSKCAAVKLLNAGNVNFQAIDNLNSANSNIDITDGFSDDEKIQAVSSLIGTTTIGSSTQLANVSSVIAYTINDLKINETARVGFLIVAADTLPQLLQQLDSVEQYCEYWLKSPSPVIDYQIANEGENVTIATNNYDILALYKEESGQKVLKETGRSFEVLIDSISYYYVQSQGRYVYNGDLVQLTGKVIPDLNIESPQLVCKNTTVLISPVGCSNYNFYRDELLTELLYTGPFLSIPNIQRDTAFYIKCAEVASENNFVHLEIKIDSVINDYVLSDTTSYVDGSINATFNQTNKAASWIWLLNNEQYGEQDDENISITFDHQGTHSLRLFATNNAGCTYIISKEIEVSLVNSSNSMVYTLENSILYPNPVTEGKINLALSQQIGKMNFEILQINGQTIENNLSYIINGNVYTIYLPSDLKPNTYLLSGSSTSGSMVWKVIVR
ncbi:S8 family serine peptidase [Flammeovirga pectinis]|uniref:S8 family serine peptidase n=1 Tax=Flammeovirga pectinis TaxID=2494373 RepID=UPI001476CC85|nr:S8 family serine peptidase [Flammeovirga pectinis]